MTMLPPLVRPEDPGVDQTPPGTHQAYREEQLLGTAASVNTTWGFGSIGLSPKRPTTSTVLVLPKKKYPSVLGCILLMGW